MAKSPSTPELPLADELARGATEGSLSHDDKWKALGPEDAAFVRAATLKAARLRTEHADPGDAYLQCLADMKRFGLLSEVAQLVTQDIDSLPETPALPEAS